MFELPPSTACCAVWIFLFFVWEIFGLAFLLRCLRNGRNCKQSDPSYWNCNATLMKIANILIVNMLMLLMLFQKSDSVNHFCCDA